MGSDSVVDFDSSYVCLFSAMMGADNKSSAVRSEIDCREFTTNATFAVGQEQWRFSDRGLKVTSSLLCLLVSLANGMESEVQQQDNESFRRSGGRRRQSKVAVAVRR